MQAVTVGETLADCGCRVLGASGAEVAERAGAGGVAGASGVTAALGGSGSMRMQGFETGLEGAGRAVSTLVHAGTHQIMGDGSLTDIAVQNMSVIDTAGGTIQLIRSDVDNAGGLFSADGTRVYVTTDREGEFVELYEVNPAAASEPWRPLSRSIPWSVESIALSGDGRTLAFTTNEDGWSTLRLLDTRTRRVT